MAILAKNLNFKDPNFGQIFMIIIFIVSTNNHDFATQQNFKNFKAKKYSSFP